MISVYADGSSHASGGKPGGWAYVILRDGCPVLCDFGGHPSTSNNRMEITAALEGLRACERLGLAGQEIELVSDSQVTLGLASGSYRPSANKDLAYPLADLTARLGARTRWVRGHDGEPWNERVDSLARKGKAAQMDGSSLKFIPIEIKLVPLA